MREPSYARAIREALRQEMRRDERVFIIGEDVGVHGGAFGVTLGLVEEFGEERMIDTPISELGITGAITGAALTGMRPVGEISSGTLPRWPPNSLSTRWPRSASRSATKPRCPSCCALRPDRAPAQRRSTPRARRAGSCTSPA